MMSFVSQIILLLLAISSPTISGLQSAFFPAAQRPCVGRVQQSQIGSNQDYPGDSQPVTTGRRRFIESIFLGTTAGSMAFVGQAHSLDMDAFANSQLEADTKNCDPKRDPKCKPEMSKDEALCKYGQSGKARGEACLRFKTTGGELQKTGSTGGKSLGGAYAM